MENEFFRGAPAQTYGYQVKQILFLHIVPLDIRHLFRNTQRRTVRNDGDLLQGIGLGQQFRQQRVAGLNVLSNVEGIATGEGLTGGNIEFWSGNYGPPNAAKIPGASDALWDFGDEFAPPEDGYGCMQVHNHEAGQTIFAINQWKGAASADVGIGNSEGKTRDWTFVGNAGQYIVKKLRVLVRPSK